jgi:integrase
MGFREFFAITDILDNDKRLKSFAEYYKNRKVNGLHYVNFYPDQNIICVCNPDHSTHHEATSFLLSCKNEGFSPNAFRNYGYHLKRFLDFLMLWDMDITDGDLLFILTGFVDYLRVIETKGSYDYPLPDKAIEWSFLTYVPLHQEARTIGKVSEIEINKFGARKKSEWGQYPSSYLSQILSAVIGYILFLHQRTNQYRYIVITDLPVKPKYKDTFLSGTLGKIKVSMFDNQSILNKVGVKAKGSGRKYEPLKERIPTVTEMNLFFSSLPPKARQNRLLFHVLKCFGLRESEAANLMIDSSTLPQNLLRMDIFEAIKYLKQHLQGDIAFNTSINKWVCSVENRNDSQTHYQARNKSTIDRAIPLFFSQEEFSMLFLDALKERELVMKRFNVNHDYIFISRAPARVGRQIRGATVYSKLKNILSHCIDNESPLQKMTPHTFRHYYATYSLRILKHEVEDVQRYLGHQDKEITLSIYTHHLHDDNEEPEEMVRDMSDTFRAAMR